MITTQRELRKAFWQAHPRASRKKICHHDDHDYTTDTKIRWFEWLDGMECAGEVSEALAKRATL